MVHLEEADGAVDIGFPTTAMFADPTKGWRWDMWYNENPAYNQINSYVDEIIFNNSSYPNTKTNMGSESFLSILNFSDIDYNMGFEIIFDDGLDIKGYYLWSFLDNFEWLFGYGPKFGLVEVDRNSLERKPKNSFTGNR